MGISIVHKCKKCGHEEEISEGGFMYLPNIDDYLKGNYGEDAKIAVEQFPGDPLSEYAVFQCRCGVVKSKLITEIYVGPKKVWTNSKCMCPLCKKRMRKCKSIPETVKCSKCGSLMEPGGYILFD